MTPVRVELLGPLRLAVDGSPVDVRGPKRRAVLALLAAAEGRVVPADHLLDALWPTEPPESGRAALQSHVSRLRAHLGPAARRLEGSDGGYRLPLGGPELDVAQAKALLAQARTDAGNDPAAALAALRAAAALWRGPVLAEFTEVPPLATTAVTYAQLRRDVTDLLIECSIRAGHTDDGVALASAAVADDPLREPAVLLLMRALATAGQSPQALDAAREYRRRLADETGLDPSPALADLERAVAGGALVPAVAPRPAAPPDRPTTPLLGRDAQVAALQRLLTNERLVTVTGPGGVGKTRVALEVARRCGSVAVLRLAPVTDPAALPHALAAALDLQVARGDVLAACIALLSGGGPAVLVVDNCEHLLEAARDVVDALLDGCPELAVLTTSREPLGLPGEACSRIGPLPLPGPDAPLARVPSVALFLDRAARVRPGFSPGPDELRVVADIVRRLDGMPLAIELAAGRMSSLALGDLADRLDRALDLLAGGRRTADARHRTLRATLEWSYGLLPHEEQRLFRHLAVFVDGVDLPTAEAVARDLRLSADPVGALAHLVDASVLEVSFAVLTQPAGSAGFPPPSPARYRMLEPLRAFGLDRLAAAAETDAAEARLLRWALDLSAWIDATAGTKREPEADAALRRELANLRAAWRFARRRGELDAAIELVLALHETIVWRDLVEPHGWADELVDDPALADHRHAAAVLGAAARTAYIRGDHARTDRLARDGLAHATDRLGKWSCHDALSLAALSRGDFADVVEHQLAAAEVAIRPVGGLDIAALAAAYAGDLAQARALHERAAGAVGSPTLRAFSRYVAGEIDNAAGQADRAEQHYRAAIATARTAGATFIAEIASVGLLTVLAGAGHVQDALRGYAEVVEYFAAAGNWTQEWVTLRNLAGLLRRLGDEDAAALLDGAADQAPDAPPAAVPAPSPPTAPVGRAQALDIARAAIHRHVRT